MADETAPVLVTLAVALLLGLLTGRLLAWIRPRQPSQHTSLPGLPLLGNAISMRHGAAFVAAARHKYGDIVTLNLAGQRMMFWFEPRLIRHFFEAPEEHITFRPAVEQFTQRVFGLPSKQFFPKHAQVLQDLRALLVPSALEAHAAALAAAVERRLPHLLPADSQEPVNLYLACRQLVFGAGVEVLFGSRAVVGDLNDERQLEAAFYAFESGFELAASPVPHVLQPGFTGARDTLLTWLGDAHACGALKGTTAGTLLAQAGLPDALAPHMLLAVLWASQANTVAATFWTLAFLLLPQHASWRQDIMRELQCTAPLESLVAPAPPAPSRPPHATSAPGPATSAPASPSVAACAAVQSLDRRSAASRAAAEAVRLRVQSIDVRMAASEFHVSTATGGKVRVPKGTILAINPYLNHLDGTLYRTGPPTTTTTTTGEGDSPGDGSVAPPAPPSSSPLVFDPTRGAADLGAPGVVVPSVAGLAFGAGFYRCPGRFFAEMEIALITQLVLAHRPGLALAATSAHPLKPQGEGAGLWAAVARGVLGPDVATWGLGLDLPNPATPSGLTPADVAGAHPDWLRHAGDPGGLLPPPDLTRLVGVKVPAGPCWVTTRCSPASQPGPAL